MLQLLSSILSWNDEQREQVGLQKSSGMISTIPGALNGLMSGSPSGGGGGGGGGKGSQGTGMIRGHSRSGKGKSTADALGDNEVNYFFSSRTCSVDLCCLLTLW